MRVQTCSITDGEELVFSKSGSTYTKVVEEDVRFQINGAHNQGDNGQQNGYDEAAVSSVPNGKSSGYKGMALMGSFHRKSMCSVGYITSDRYHVAQNTVNGNLTGHLHEDSERVLKKQDIHDVYCPTCNFYFTKRVTLPRKPISPDLEDVVVPPIRQISTTALRNDDSNSDSTSCLSYFKTALFTGEVSVAMPDNREPLLGHQREGSGVEVIKAIVYGGLLESIASLSVVVSAAGGDATTLNIVALGLANVFGGLLVLANNLTTLKELTGQQYEDQLGQPRHFLIHSLIAVISYFVFGLASPLIYGFSFYKSDNKYLKLATLATAYLVFVSLLSAGKAYVQRPPKQYLQTMYYYIGFAVTGSGAAYIVGDLITILLKKLHVFK
ncbi:hypothetical protein RND81_04G004500 [Saponaria officinalis]|uniref:Membrane protein of ER body-like protein n=1 Tax=Saponaria officinalis TaxID=3572 RepID=A0AAW1LBR9_SAPOF